MLRNRQQTIVNRQQTTVNSKQTLDTKKQPEDLGYKKLLEENNKNKEESLTDKYKILEQEGLIREGKDKCWYNGELLVFTEEDIEDQTIDSIKKSLVAYKQNRK